MESVNQRKDAMLIIVPGHQVDKLAKKTMRKMNVDVHVKLWKPGRKRQSSLVWSEQKWQYCYGSESKGRQLHRIQNKRWENVIRGEAEWDSHTVILIASHLWKRNIRLGIVVSVDGRKVQCVLTIFIVFTCDYSHELTVLKHSQEQCFVSII